MRKIISILVLILIVAGGFFYFNKEEKLELLGDSEMTVSLNEQFDDPGVNIKDVSIDGRVDTSKEDSYTITYSYHNQTLKRIVHVVDPSRIIINLNGDENTFVKQNDPYIESGCHAIDKKAGNITNDVTISSDVDTTTVGDYQVTYKVTHDFLTVEKTRTVHVIKESEFEENTKGIPVLMYHYVYTKDDIPDTLNVNYILDTKLEEQLQYLTENNYYFPSYKELEAYINNQISLPKNSVILTFDDGQKGFLKYGIPLLEKYKVPATSFIIGNKNGEEKITQYASEYVSFQSHSYSMHQGGGNIGHGGIISAMSEKEIISDLKKAQEIVQNTEAFAYPYGDVTTTAQSAIKKCNILCSFTTHYGRVTHGADPTYLPRVRVLGDASLKSYISTIKE